MVGIDTTLIRNVPRARYILLRSLVACSISSFFFFYAHHQRWACPISTISTTSEYQNLTLTIGKTSVELVLDCLGLSTGLGMVSQPRLKEPVSYAYLPYFCRLSMKRPVAQSTLSAEKEMLPRLQTRNNRDPPPISSTFLQNRASMLPESLFSLIKRIDHQADALYASMTILIWYA